MVSWFLSFLVSKFEGFLLSKFPSFLVSKFLQWSHITKHPFHAFWKIMIPCPRFSRKFKTGLHDFAVPAFSNFQIFDLQPFEMNKHHVSNNFRFSLIIWSALVPQKINNIGFWAHGHNGKSQNHGTEGFSVSPTSKLKSY